MDDPGRQLQEELSGSIRRALASNGPILTHVNADTTWLLQLPYPESYRERIYRSPSKHLHYNILIDPWLRGPQSDVGSWFSRQWHTTSSSVQTIQELEDCLFEIEQLARAQIPKATNRKRSSDVLDRSKLKLIDAVVLSHEFSDHTHKETLLGIDPSTPVFANKKAAELVLSFHHFEQVFVAPPFSGKESDWRDTSAGPLPPWIGISRLTTKDDALYYHSAIMIAFDITTNESNGTLEENEAEAVVYSPHGIVADDLRPLPKAIPPIKVLALMHGLHDVGITFATQLNLGAFNGLRAQRICQAKYWVGTHDEVKRAGGFIAPFLRRKKLTIQEAVQNEKQGKGYIFESGELTDMQDVRFAELVSGESILLE